jgi:Cu/Ag efflux pump CusA
MLNSIVKWSIAQRWLVVIASIWITLWGFRVLAQMPLDVFPSFAPPQVEIQNRGPRFSARGSSAPKVLVPIRMTALLSALGMVPLVIGTGADKEILQPLAVVLGGLFTSTALTLLVLPALYAQLEKYFIPKNRTQFRPVELPNNRVFN